MRKINKLKPTVKSKLILMRWEMLFSTFKLTQIRFVCVCVLRTKFPKANTLLMLSAASCTADNGNKTKDLYNITHI